MIVTIPVIGFAYLYYNLNSMFTSEDDSIDDETQESKYDFSIKNILLVGLDNKNLEKGSRSDCMMILTIDNKNKKIKLTSLARDTYVDIKGYSSEKLTHAYAYEGSKLLIEVIEDNFGIKIDRYISVNFESFIELIDLIGGVDVEVNEDDINILNDYIKSCYNYVSEESKEKIKFINSCGHQTLNGYQALAFSRIRFQDGAIERDKRQRQVLTSAIDKLQKSGVNKYIGLIKLGVKNVKTDMIASEIIKIGYDILKIGSSNIEQIEFPIYKENVRLDKKGWVIKWDKDDNLRELKKFIFN